MRFRHRCAYLICLAVAGLLLATTHRVQAQTFGVDLHNSLMPASGGMAGVSITRPQDLTSALNGNPATLVQFPGTQILLGSAWAEPTYNASYDGGDPLLNALGVSAFSSKSDAQGSLAGNVGVTREFCLFDFPVTIGLGLITGSGIGTDFRDVAASGGVAATYNLLETTVGAGIGLTDRLSAGATLSLGYGTFYGGFVENSAESYDYALRGSFGLNYFVGCDTSVGVYYQTEQSFNFENAVFILGRFVNIEAEEPRNVGIGIANSSLMDGRLLLAADFLFKDWSDADFWGKLFKDQWVYQFGAQYSMGPLRFRVGYAFNTDPVQSNVGGNVGPPLTAGQAAVQYLQAVMAGASSQHRLTGGVGYHDILPGVDIDLLAGGMFKGSDTYGAHSASSVESYWLGLGLTWRIGHQCAEGSEAACCQ